VDSGSLKRNIGEMLVSAELGRTTQIDADKVSRGAYFTTDAAWLNEPVEGFLRAALKAKAGRVLDPFAGDGHLLELVASRLGAATTGLDIAGGRWPVNDSLLRLPAEARDAVIVTNPPYLANHSASRKGVASLAAEYFAASAQDNLYKIALDRCLEASDYVVAVIPETFLLSGYPADRLVLASVIESPLFADTDAPALVACFGPAGSEANQQILLGDKPIATLGELQTLRAPNSQRPARSSIVFNAPDGRIGLRAVDAADAKNPIRFYLAADFEYPIGKVRHSSRLMTYLDVPQLEAAKLGRLVAEANRLLGEIRAASADLVLAPFKGNDKTGTRRRRLDYALARKILELALASVSKL
jgi:hypothetical protein